MDRAGFDRGDRGPMVESGVGGDTGVWGPVAHQNSDLQSHDDAVGMWPRRQKPLIDVGRKLGGCRQVAVVGPVVHSEALQFQWIQMGIRQQ